MMTFTIAAFIQILVFIFLLGSVLGAWLILRYEAPKNPGVKKKK